MTFSFSSFGSLLSPSLLALRLFVLVTYPLFLGNLFLYHDFSVVICPLSPFLLSFFQSLSLPLPAVPWSPSILFPLINHPHFPSLRVPPSLKITIALPSVPPPYLFLFPPHPVLLLPSTPPPHSAPLPRGSGCASVPWLRLLAYDVTCFRPLPPSRVMDVAGALGGGREEPLEKFWVNCL